MFRNGERWSVSNWMKGRGWDSVESRSNNNSKKVEIVDGVSE